ncbi:MAG: YHS domain-containing (seleno)protein [Pseudomonadota bacterium]
MSSIRLTRRGALGLASAITVLATVPAFADTATPHNVDAAGLMLRGYDPVAYFTLGTPTPGSTDITAEHDGATYRFASNEHRELFLADPAAYAPAYGGYCALGAAMGRKFDGDPELWAVVDGRLFVNVNAGAQRRWQSNPEGFVTTADHNWPLIEGLGDGTLETSPPAGLRVGAN